MMNGYQPKMNSKLSIKPPTTGSKILSPIFTLPESKCEIINSRLMVYTDTDSTEHIVEVYDIAYNSNGYPVFLIYLDGQWIRKSAKYFRPMKG